MSMAVIFNYIPISHNKWTHFKNMVNIFNVLDNTIQNLHLHNKKNHSRESISNDQSKKKLYFWKEF